MTTMTTKKRGFGEGTIEPSGRGHRVRMRVAGQREDLGTYATPAEAESVRVGFLALQARGEQPSAALTLRTWGTTWLRRRELNGTRNIATDRSRWETHIMRAHFADWPLRAIERRDVRTWMDGLLRKAPGWQTRKHCVNLLRKALGDALEDEHIERNAAAGFTVNKPADADDGWTFLMPEEQQALAAATPTARTERERLAHAAELQIALVAIGTGLRQGEQWNLELVDVHIDDADPWLYVRWGSRGKAPKNGKARRVPLFGLALAAMRLWLASLPFYAPRNPLGLAFPTERGCRRQRSKLPRSWGRVLAAARLADGTRRHDRRGVRWHDLRHTCASALVAGWWGRRWSLQEVAEVLGHSSVTVTERYAHLAPGVIAGAAAATTGPNLARAPLALVSNSQTIPGRDTQDSNLRPPASEAGHIENDPRYLGALRASLRAKCEQYLGAVVARSRFAHRYGTEAAELGLELCEALEAGPAARLGATL